jgi:CRISPR/Cas system-associated exonuclease Cas4 (RecB family)
MRTIRASEIGTFLYCHRAWWYQKSGQPSQNLGEMAAGSELHYRHGRAVLGISCLRLLASALMLLALAMLVLYFVEPLL